MQRLHPATIVINLFEFVRQFAITIFIVAISSAGRDDATFEILMAGLGGLGVLAAVYRYIVTGYGIEGGTLVVKRGGLWKQVRTIPLDRIQNVTIKRSLVERIFGVCSVVVETAAGLQAEAQLSSLSQDDAESLRSRLLSVVSTNTGPSFELPPVLYMVTMRELVFAGALQNRALLILVSILGFLQFGAQSDAIENLVKGSRDVNLPVTTWIAIGLGLFAVGWAVSIVATIIKFGGFRIDRYERGLRMHYGLLAQTEVLLPVRRVQALMVSRPLLFRWFKYAEIRAEALGSFDEKVATGGVMLSPIVHETRVNRLVNLVFPGRTATDIEWRPISRKAIRRGFIRRMISWAFLMGVVAVPIQIAESVPELSWLKMTPTGWWLFGALGVLISATMAVASFRRAGWRIDDEFLMIRGGVFRQNVEFVPRRMIQWCELSSTWFMRRMKLANISVTTAVRTHEVPELDLHDAETLLSELTFSESHEGATAAIIGA